VSVGFVGCGVHSTQNLYPCLRHFPVVLQSVCALHEFKAKRNAAWFGAKRWYTDYRKMIEQEKLDAVFIVVNRHTHKEIASYALNKGIHVFLEKPPAMNGEEVAHLSALSEKTKKVCMVGYQKRYVPTYKKAKELLMSNSFNPSMVHLRFSAGNMNSEEDFLYEIGIHFIDLLRYFQDDIGQLSVDRKQQKGFSYTISCRFKNDNIGSLVLTSTQSWNNPSERVEIYGDKGTILVDNLYNIYFYKRTMALPGEIVVDGKGAEFWLPNFTVPNDKLQSLCLNGYFYEIQAFINAVKGGNRPEGDIKDSKQNIEIIQKLLQTKNSSFTFTM
jgi:predicted dehydrogenase